MLTETALLRLLGITGLGAFSKCCLWETKVKLNQHMQILKFKD